MEKEATYTKLIAVIVIILFRTVKRVGRSDTDVAVAAVIHKRAYE